MVFPSWRRARTLGHMSRMLLAEAVLAIHLAVIVFNVAGLAVIPLGAWRGWAWTRIVSWRALHVASWAAVALQALLGRACFLTLWQDALNAQGPQPPLAQRWVNGLIYWPLPIWVFSGLYLALFAAVLGLWAWPPTRPARRRWRGARKRA